MPSADASLAQGDLGRLIWEVFRLNSRLLASGDRLVAELGLTSARWQVLGAIAMTVSGEPVAWLARSMGLQRQGVQRIVNELVVEGLVEFRENPHHRRAQLAVLTEKGRDTYQAAMRKREPWIAALSQGLSSQEVAVAYDVLTRLRTHLECSER